MTEILTAENCFRRIMDRKKGNAGKKRSPNSGTNGNNLKLLLHSTLSFIIPCSWRAVISIFHIGIRHYSETWMIENSRRNEKL
jgi:hypothetical protein